MNGMVRFAKKKKIQKHFYSGSRKSQKIILYLKFKLENKTIIMEFYDNFKSHTHTYNIVGARNSMAQTDGITKYLRIIIKIMM